MSPDANRPCESGQDAARLHDADSPFALQQAALASACAQQGPDGQNDAGWATPANDIMPPLYSPLAGWCGVPSTGG